MCSVVVCGCLWCIHVGGSDRGGGRLHTSVLIGLYILPSSFIPLQEVTADAFTSLLNFVSRNNLSLVYVCEKDELRECTATAVGQDRLRQDRVNSISRSVWGVCGCMCTCDCGSRL